MPYEHLINWWLPIRAIVLTFALLAVLYAWPHILSRIGGAEDGAQEQR